MNQDFSQQLAARQFSEVEQLLNYIEQTAIDSESTPISPDEVEIVTHLVIQRLVLGIL